jgi:hypothetical protein
MEAIFGGKANVIGTLRGMEVGEVQAFPIERLRVVRVAASEIGVILSRKYRTRSDRDRQIVMVKREC